MILLGILTLHGRWIMTAIQHIERLARGRSEQAVAVIRNVQQMSNIPMQEMQAALKQLLHCGRVALHFIPTNR